MMHFFLLYAPGIYRAPKTGETIRVESKKLPFFKCGKELKCYRALKFEKTEYVVFLQPDRQ